MRVEGGGGGVVRASQVGICVHSLLSVPIWSRGVGGDHIPRIPAPTSTSRGRDQGVTHASIMLIEVSRASTAVVLAPGSILPLF